MSVQNAVHWFEIPVNNLERAKQFYEAITGLQLQPMEMNGGGDEC